MRDAVLSGALAFVAVLVMAVAFQPPGPEVTPTPISVSPVVKCGVPEPDCQKLATEFIARARSANPGKIVASVAVVSPNEFQACFTDGSCFGEASGVGVPEAVPNPPAQAP